MPVGFCYCLLCCGISKATKTKRNWCTRRQTGAGEASSLLFSLTAIALRLLFQGSGPHARVRFDSRVLSPAHIIIAQLKEGNQKPVLTIQTARKKRAAFAHTDANIAGVQVCFCFPFVRPCARVCLRRPIQAAICAVFLALETRLVYTV